MEPDWRAKWHLAQIRFKYFPKDTDVYGDTVWSIHKDGDLQELVLLLESNESF